MSKIINTNTAGKDFYKIFDNDNNVIISVIFVGARMLIQGYTGEITSIKNESSELWGDETTIIVKMDSEKCPNIIITADLINLIKPVTEINGNNYSKYYFII